MADNNHVVVFDGVEYRVTVAQFQVIQKLRSAITAVADGTDAAFALVERDHFDRTRMCYFSPDPSSLDGLSQDLDTFRKYLSNQAVLAQGNAPPASRSLTVQ